jgi:hypothetical protein
MSVILFSLWAVVLLCNIYVSRLQIQLFHKGLVHTHWKFGTGLLDAALQEATDAADIRMIRRAKTIFRISVAAFIPFIILAGWRLFTNA